MYSATANLARVRVSKRCRWYISFFRVAKNDSAAALSQHTPVRPTLVWMWLRAQNVASSAEVYWAAAVGVEDRAGLDVAVPDGHGEGVDDQAGAQVVGGLPADHHAGGQVDDGGQVQPALAGLEVGDVTDQPGARPGGGEVPADQVRAFPSAAGRAAWCACTRGAGTP